MTAEIFWGHDVEAARRDLHADGRLVCGMQTTQVLMILIRICKTDANSQMRIETCHLV